MLLSMAMTVMCTRAITPPVEVFARPGLGREPIARIVVALAEPDRHAEGIPPADLEMVSELVIDSLVATGRWAVEPEPADFSGGTEGIGRRASVGAVAASAQAAMAIEISRIVHRVGGDYGIRKPASVAFWLFLVPAGEDEAVWRARYSFTQQPLSQNLWNLWGVLRGGPKWLTARELAAIGIDEAVARLAAAAR